MSGIVQLERPTANQGPSRSQGDTWILELSAEVCQAEGFPTGTLVTLTIRDGGIQTSIIEPSPEIDDFVAKVVDEEREFLEEMKRLGD